MLRRAPRHLLRPLRRLMRGGLLMSSLWMAGAAAAEIRLGAGYVEPTTRYAHGVLGDAIEWGGIEFENGKRFRLPENLVFEDLHPREVEIDGITTRKPAGQGIHGHLDKEYLVVESHLDKGARLAIWDDTGRITATPYIGQRNRWLAPIGAADLDGDGYVEVAYIDRPHLAKTLRIWRFKDGKLIEIASASGYTNHKIGWDYIEGGIAWHCGPNPALIVASADWQNVVSLEFDGKSIRQTILGPYSAKRMRSAQTCQ